MTLLEQKVDAIARSLLSNDFMDRNAALTELAQLMKRPVNEDKIRSTAEQVDKILLDLGTPENILGFGYLQTAIQIAVEDPSAIANITKVLYPAVAKKHGTTKSRAERAIRHAIENGWDRCDFDMREKYFGSKISPEKGKPTNSEFIARCANIVRVHVERGGVTNVLQNLSRMRSALRPLRAL